MNRKYTESHPQTWKIGPGSLQGFGSLSQVVNVRLTDINSLGACP